MLKRGPIAIAGMVLFACGQRPVEDEALVDTSRAVTLRSPMVSPAEHHDASPPLMLMVPAERQHVVEHEVKRIPRGPPGNFVTLPRENVQSSVAALAIPATSTAFEGIGQGFTGPAGTFTVNAAPPDTNGDVGPGHYVQTVNTDFAVFNKSGTVLYGPVPLNTLWSGFGGGCQTNNDGDPTVIYDPLADRWVISQFSVSTTPYLQCVAVSQTGDPTGAYFRYAFGYGSTDFPDYPKIGVWPDAYYTTFNIFANGRTFTGAKSCAYDRASMLAGQAATQQCFSTSSSWGGLLPADLDGARQPPAGSPNYQVAFGTNNLGVWKFHVDWAVAANSTFTGPTQLAVAAFTEACNGGTCIPQSGTSQQLDSLADRLMYRLAYRNFADHEAMVVSHSITAGNSAAIRWYELRVASQSISVFQQGTYAPDSNYRWMGSLAMDQQGNIGLGFSISSSSLHPEIHYSGRLAGDAAGQMTQGEGSIIDPAGSQSGQGLSRWGDYSMMAIDPADDCTFWYTTEYLTTTGAFNWHTRIGAFKFPGCGAAPANDFSIGASPSSLSLMQNNSGTSTISTAVTSGAAESIALGVGGVPSGATAALSPTSVIAGGSSTLTVNAGTAAAGTYTLTVTGTAPSATHSTTVMLTVTAPPPANDFSISSNPSSLSLAQNTGGTSTISTAVVSGTAETINLTVSGAPSGASASLNPTSVSAGGTSTLSVNAGTAAAGTYTLTVTGTATSAIHTTTVALTVTAAASSGITNGGFETGTLSGWTAAGSAAVVTGGHGGTYAARVGSTAAFNGDSSIAQTFTAPSAGGTLTFWYKVVCTDTVTYDWATATLADTTAGTTATVLPKTCTNSGAWLQASASLAGGHVYKLTLIDHDDNYATDPTYTLYDDVAIGAPPPAGITNGGFETGTLSGWAKAGSASVTTTAHSGTYSALVGSTAPTNGDSSLSQTFTIPAGAATLSLYYANRCPDTVTYDWVTVTLKDNVAGTTRTLVPKTCAAVYQWTNVTASVTAGRSYTLTLISHDDNYAGDATYTLFDDVVLQ